VRRLLLAAVLGLLSGAGCNNACYNLAKTICQCEPTSNSIAVCNNQVAVRNGIASPTSEDLQRCQNLLNVCDCRSLQSQSLAAKVSCGLARENPTDKALNP